MKKFMAVMAIVLFSTAVFAQGVKRDVKKDVKTETPKLDVAYSLYGIAYSVSGIQDDYVYDVAHIRLNPGIVLSSGDIRGVLQFEIDQDFGRNGAGVSDTGADPGTDNFVVGVKWAYLEVSNLILAGITAGAGLDAYSFPLVVDNDFALFRASYDFGIGKAVVSYIKINEYSQVEKDAANVEDNRDVDAFAADIPLKFGVFGVRPGLIFVTGGEQSTIASDARILNFALNVTADISAVNFALTGAYMTGDADADTSASAYAFDASAEIKLFGSIRAGGFCTYGSGDDGTGSEDNSYFYMMNMLFGTTAKKTGAPDGRLMLLENATVANSTAAGNAYDTMDDSRGYMSAGVFAEAEYMKIKLFVQGGIASLVKADASGNKMIGAEFDLGASYTVAYNTEIFVEAAFLFGGDVIVGPAALADAENVTQFAFGMTTDL
ncbi:MAG TPA: hypothetical protein PK514_08975 [Spirochaetota bacterium]|nr:hypothetical protein [Spirochaetota bacterium]